MMVVGVVVVMGVVRLEIVGLLPWGELGDGVVGRKMGGVAGRRRGGVAGRRRGGGGCGRVMLRQWQWLLRLLLRRRARGCRVSEMWSIWWR